MNVKKHCNCPTEKLNKESYNGLLFEAMVMANKDQKARSIVLNNGDVSHINKNAAIELGMKIFANVPVGLKSITNVEQIERPY